MFKVWDAMARQRWSYSSGAAAGIMVTITTSFLNKAFEKIMIDVLTKFLQKDELGSFLEKSKQFLRLTTFLKPCSSKLI